jgi:hypothetical protein
MAPEIAATGTSGTCLKTHVPHVPLFGVTQRDECPGMSRMSRLAEPKI